MRNTSAPSASAPHQDRPDAQVLSAPLELGLQLGAVGIDPRVRGAGERRGEVLLRDVKVLQIHLGEAHRRERARLVGGLVVRPQQFERPLGMVAPSLPQRLLVDPLRP
ncbi:MAG: hypothetical protein U0324_17705 [Polyangiales bacterium]